MGSSKAVTVGFRYYFGILMGLCRGPINAVVEIRVADKTAWSGNQTDSGTININAGDLFGGDKAEGGIQGPLQLMMGKADQTGNPDYERMVGGPRPGFRGVATAFYDGLISSMNPYPKPWAFRMRRTTAGWDGEPWYPEKCTIILTRPTAEGEVTSSPEIHAMNPAHIIYECLTNRDWGRGLSPSRINIASFVAAADALYAEGFGLCMRWVRRDTLRNFLKSVIDHIAAALYNDRTTGLITLKLIRQDYLIETLPLYDADSGLLAVEEAPVGALAPMVNECAVTFHDVIRDEDMTVSTQNLASMQANGGTFNSIKRSFSGIPIPALALRVAQRELKASSVGLRKYKVQLDRRAWRLAPGDVFRIRDRARGIEEAVLRVGRIETGTLLRGNITVTAVSDVFSFPLASFTAVQPPPNIPRFEPKPTRWKIFEIPYALIARYTAPADLVYIPEDAGYIGGVAERPDPVHGGFDFAVKDGAPDPSENANG